MTIRLRRRHPPSSPSHTRMRGWKEERETFVYMSDGLSHTHLLAKGERDLAAPRLVTSPISTVARSFVCAVGRSPPLREDCQATDRPSFPLYETEKLRRRSRHLHDRPTMEMRPCSRECISLIFPLPFPESDGFLRRPVLSRLLQRHVCGGRHHSREWRGGWEGN